MALYEVGTKFMAACSVNDEQVCLDALPQRAADDSFIAIVLSTSISIVAAIAVLMVVIGGMRYILSQGDPKGVSQAKSTIIYALLGLVIAIFAQAVVTFTLGGIWA